MLQILVLTGLSPRNDGRMGVASDHTAAMGASSIRERIEKEMFMLNADGEKEKISQLKG